MRVASYIEIFLIGVIIAALFFIFTCPVGVDSCPAEYTIDGVPHTLPPDLDYVCKYEHHRTDRHRGATTLPTSAPPPPLMNPWVSRDLLANMKHLLAACDRMGVRIWACTSTLLGAVRHGGFVPWYPTLSFSVHYDDLENFVSLRSDLERGGSHTLAVEENGYSYRTRSAFFKGAHPKITVFIYGHPGGDGTRLGPCTPFDELHRPTFEDAAEPSPGVFDTTDLFPLSHMTFEDQLIPVPRASHRVLESVYGSDYARTVRGVPILFSIIGNLKVSAGGSPRVDDLEKW